MANINTSWTPVSGVLNQTVSTRKKGDLTWITSNFNPSNNQTSLQSSAIYQNADVNTVYEFKVNSICTGSVTSLDSSISEGINFSCTGWSITSNTDTTINTLVPATMLSNTITKVNVTILDSLFGVVQTQDTPYIGVNVINSFTGLTPSTLYNVRITLFATVNGVERQSNSGSMAPCSIQVTTDAPPSSSVSFGQQPTSGNDALEYYFSRVDTSAAALAQDLCITFNFRIDSNNTLVGSGSTTIFAGQTVECNFLPGDTYCNNFPYVDATLIGIYDIITTFC